jgi:DNA-binding HxlR family transcriptional regulator
MAVPGVKPGGSGVPDVAECVEAVFGCKWSIRILTLIRRGVRRPGEIERSLPGLTTKVQHHYFRRMVSLGILSREVYAEVPPRVEYRLTPFGERFVPLLEQIERFQNELAGEVGRETAAGTGATSTLG